MSKVVKKHKIQNQVYTYKMYEINWPHKICDNTPSHSLADTFVNEEVTCKRCLKLMKKKELK